MKTYRQTKHRRLADGSSAAAWWEPGRDPSRIDCLLCPRKCSLKPGDRGFCFVRENRDGELVLSTYGRSTGFCIDPIEKKPLNHFFPGTPVLSFGTAGCNLGCKFCQNWDISKSRQVQRLSALAEPETIARAAVAAGATSVAYTYNDPVVWAEYAIDTAKACRAAGVKNVAVTAGYITPEAREEFFEHIDAANVDLKAFTEDFYHRITYAHLEPVLETLKYLRHQTQIWFEITNLIIPDCNDKPGDLRRMCDWILESIGDQVPIHFTAFHPDFRMMETAATDPQTLQMAQDIALDQGLRYVYVGNVDDAQRQSTYCHSCGQLLIERNWYRLGAYNIDVAGCCNACQTSIPGRFGPTKGNWGARRQPIQIEQFSGPVPAVAYEDKERDSNDSVYPLEEIRVSSVNREVAPNTTAGGVEGGAESGPSQPQLLDVGRLSQSEQQSIVRAAAAMTSCAVLESPPTEVSELPNSLVMGAFVTLKRGDVLRGCCGVLGRTYLLQDALSAAARKTAREDHRMAAISPSELAFLSIDVTLLGPFQKLEETGRARAEAITIGKHGVMIQRGKQSGLLLPSVATERGWDAHQFLGAVCTKAGLPIGSWESPDATLFAFEGFSMGGQLSDFLAINVPARQPAPITREQLSQYAQIAGQNIAAMVAGGTPSYVIPHLPDGTINALVLSMQWAADDQSDPPVDQGNAMQVSIRPGVPLQSTLFQMCQQAAAMFQQRRFAGQLQIGLTLGFDPALHGYGGDADLTGIDPSIRGLIISDARHCGLAFLPEKSMEEIRDELRARLPIGSRDAAVHSMELMSTLPSVTSVSTPRQSLATGERPPAVAGKFYPAEDAARRAMVGTLFKGAEPPQSSPMAIMVPHAGIKYSGRVAARAWQSVENLADRTLVVVSPKHTSHGVNWAVCPFQSWRISSTTSIAGDPELASAIADAVTPLQLDAAAHQTEHGIEVQLPILERLAPGCKVVGLALSNASWEDTKQAAAEFAEFLGGLPELPLLVVSSDMNHFAPDDENRRRDRLALDALATGDPKQLIDVCRDHAISMCGLIPAAFVLETLRQLKRSFSVTEVAYSTSAETSGDKSQVVGYASALLQATSN